MKANPLKSVFWEYPRFTEEKTLREILSTLRAGTDQEFYFWILRRFLEYGRAIDVLRFFSIEEIESNLHRLHLRDYSAKKWQRLAEVYRAAKGEPGLLQLCRPALHPHSALPTSPHSRSIFPDGMNCTFRFFLHHRSSDNLDFFTIDQVDLSEISFWLRTVWPSEHSNVRTPQQFLSVLIRDVKVEFL